MVLAAGVVGPADPDRDVGGGVLVTGHGPILQGAPGTAPGAVTVRVVQGSEDGEA